MNIINNEKEHLKVVEFCYDEILKIKNDIIDYLSQYNYFTIDYIKNLFKYIKQIFLKNIFLIINILI